VKRLLETIERVLPEGGDWCTLHKAQTLAALVVGLRPRTVVEIGVWMGGSLVPMLLALQHVGNHDAVAVAIDPWSPAASVDGETGANLEWWSTVDHDAAFRAFCARLDKHTLRSYCRIERASSNDVMPPSPIDVIHIDGNHRAQALRDVARFCPQVRVGGIAVLDDVDWEGGHVNEGVEQAKRLGFVAMYPLDRGLVMQRRGAIG
jgi:predicted O-methyltransferase YrrM